MTERAESQKSVVSKEDSVLSGEAEFDYDEEDTNHGGHGEKPHSIANVLASAIINFLLMFGLCCAYGMIMFEEDQDERHRGLAVKMNLATAGIVGILLSCFSKVGVAIGGPDLNPVVFLGMFAQTIASKIAEEKASEMSPLDSADFARPSQDRRLLEACGRVLSEPGEFLRRLAGGSSGGNVTWCIDGTSHYDQFARQCDDFHKELRATVIFSTMVSSALLGLAFFCLGRFRLTHYVSYLPTSIMEAFLSCIGYKVFKYAVKFCNDEPYMFLPAACVGVPLYFIKALHLGKPAIVMPMVLLVPLGIFYIGVFATGGMEKAREADWFFSPQIADAPFWEVWTDGIISYEHINFKAWSATLVDLVVMLVVCVLDCMLKLYSTESKLPVKVDQDYEIQLYGLSNILTTLFGSSVGYMQLKFNVINYGVNGNVTDRRGGLLYAIMCGLCFLITTQLFNLLPRWFLSTLLFFAGAGFVAENLWGSRKYLSIWEWMQVVVILFVFIFSKSLLYAVVTGGLLAGVSFIRCYADVPCLAGPPLTGGEVRSTDHRSYTLQRMIRHVANSWSLVVRLKGYLFFVSANSLTSWVLEQIEAQQSVPSHRRLRWIVLDCKQLDGMDSSASKAFAKLANSARAMNVHLIWSGVKEEFVQMLKSTETIKSDHHWFRSQDKAIHHIEGLVLNFIHKQHHVWVGLHPMFALASQMINERFAQEPWEEILLSDASRFGCPWKYCSRLELKAGTTVLCRAGKFERRIFLIYSGKVGLYADDSSRPSGRLAVFRRGRFVNTEALLRKPAHLTAMAVEDGQALFWTQHQWMRMEQAHPLMASAVFRAVLRQQDEDASEHGVARFEPQAEEDEGLALPQRTGSGNSFTTYTSSRSNLSLSANLNDLKLETEKTMQPSEDTWWVRGVAVTRALADLGFFEPAGEQPASHPKPPDVICQDLAVAFSTYAGQSETAEPAVAPEQVGEALQYAGLYSTALLQKGAVQEPLDKASFLALGAEAAMTALSEHQADKAIEIFKRHATGDFIECSAMPGLFRKEVHPSLSFEIVDGLTGLWGKKKIDEETFVAIISRFVKVHELYWCVLVGIRELRGNPEEQTGEEITAEALANYSGLSTEEAEKLLWSAGSFVGNEDGQSLNVQQVPVGLLPINVQTVELVPVPKDPGASTPKVELTTPSFIDVRSLPLKKADLADMPARLGCKRLSLLQKQFDNAAAAQSVVNVFTEKHSEKTKEAPLKEVPPGCRPWLHMVLDYPDSSSAAKLWAIFVGVLILISVLIVFVRPVVTPPNEPATQVEKDVWNGFELFLTIVFTIEFVARALVADALGTETTLDFFKKPMNICDLVAVMPWYIDQVINVEREEFRLLRVVRLMKLARLVRLGRLSYRSAVFAPIAMILVVIWGIYMMNNL